MKFFSRSTIATLAILAIAASLRFYALDFQSLWNDELSSVSRTQPELLSKKFWEMMKKDVHPPGYILLLKGWFKIFGSTSWVARSLSAIAGVLLVWATIRTSRRLFGEGPAQMTG